MSETKTNEPVQGCRAVEWFEAKKEKPTMLIVGDSPTLSSGFARVVQNLTRRWKPYFGKIDFWGIGYNGWPPVGEWSGQTIYPAGWPFTTTARCEELCGLVSSGRYTHLWMIQDLFNLSTNGLPDKLAAAVRLAYLKTGKPMCTALYFPVDAPIEPWWLDILKAVKLPVAYTRYGKIEVERVLRYTTAGTTHFVDAIPHGVDTSVYRPLENQAGLRSKIFEDGWAKDDWLIVNVASNQRRKGLTQMFEIVRWLKADGVPVKLYLHMAPHNRDEGIDLEIVAGQVGLKEGEDWRHGGAYFKSGSSAHSLVSETTLNKVYNAADIFLTTTLGEGWGLPIVEAAASGLECFVPDNTSCREIATRLAEMGDTRMHRLPLSNAGLVNMHDNSRLRYPVDSKGAAYWIRKWVQRVGVGASRVGHMWLERKGLVEEAEMWLDWDEIAKRWLEKMGVR